MRRGWRASNLRHFSWRGQGMLAVLEWQACLTCGAVGAPQPLRVICISSEAIYEHEVEHALEFQDAHTSTAE